MDNYHFIVNPIAGAGHSKRLFSEAQDIMEKEGIAYTHVLSKEPGHVSELVRTAVEVGHKKIVAVGGDGTVRKSAQVIMGRNDVAMGILPFGTGNDLARALKIPFDPCGALNVLFEGRVRPMDMGIANGCAFANVAGFGFDTEVIVRTEKFKRRFGGMLPYILGVIQALVSLKPIRMHLTADGREIYVEALLVAVANGTHYGGGMYVSPSSDPFDGKLDVCLVKKVGLIKLLFLLPAFIKGHHINKKPVDYFSTRELRIESSVNHSINLDGELGSSTPVTFGIIPGALNIFVPDLKLIGGRQPD